MLNTKSLINTRLLIQANSGGGKSYAIRKILEDTHSKVQHIVLDVEGEFSTLRKKYDYLLAGPGADIQAHPKSAAMLARKLLEYRPSCIIDLYELKNHERHRYIRLFLESLMSAPKKLWQPVIIVIDEAHLFCPEKSKSEAMPAVVDLATRGRKRQFCGILATQRISKLNKDAAAECINKLIGRTGLDIDMKRAADELGFNSKKEMLSLRDLAPGEFYAFGPAISQSVRKIKIGKVKTPHGFKDKMNDSYKKTPSRKIKSLLSKLDDLPAQAENELREKQDYLLKIRELEKRLSSGQTVDHGKALVKSITLKKSLASAERKISDLEKTNKKLVAKIDKASSVLSGKIDLPSPHIPHEIYQNESFVAPKAIPEARQFNKTQLGRCEKAILSALFDGAILNKIQIGIKSGYRHSSGGFNNSLSKLKNQGYVIKIGSNFQITEQAKSILVESGPEKLPSLQDWCSKLGKCERTIFQAILDSPAKTWNKEEIGEQVGYSPGSGGFNNALSRLNSLGLIEKKNGQININQEIACL